MLKSFMSSKFRRQTQLSESVFRLLASCTEPPARHSGPPSTQRRAAWLSPACPWTRPSMWLYSLPNLTTITPSRGPPGRSTAQPRRQTCRRACSKVLCAFRVDAAPRACEPPSVPETRSRAGVPARGLEGWWGQVLGGRAVPLHGRRRAWRREALTKRRAGAASRGISSSTVTFLARCSPAAH